MLKYLLVILLISLSLLIYGQETSPPTPNLLTKGITVDLREPFYIDGVLTTEKGGIITGPGLRVQALKICYIRKLMGDTPQLTIEAQGELLVEFGEHIFVGDRIFYDFQKKEGVLYQGRTSSAPWYFGGDRIELCSDGSYVIYTGYVTTSENVQPEWDIFSPYLSISPDRRMEAKDVQLRFLQYPILWIPSLKINLNSIYESPIRYRFKWGGRQGPRFGLTYEALTWKNWKTYFRFDYRLTKGPGIGVEFAYHSLDRKTHFQSINYIARDSSLLNRHEKLRYRFEGRFHKLMDQDKLKIYFTYDKISDTDMPGSYCDRDFDFKTSERTQFLVRRQEEDWIGRFYTRLRLNGFQTIKQELPTLTCSFRPFLLRNTHIVSENRAQVGYLNYKYSHHLPHARNFSSTRLEYQPKLYRPFLLGPITFTPEIGAVAIFYGNSPHKDDQWLLSGNFGTELRTQLYRFYSPLKRTKHVIEPYISYRYYSSPTSSACQHYIFDIGDGWAYLNRLTFGVKNLIYVKSDDSSIYRWLYADIYAHSFFNQKHLSPLIPKIYSHFTLFPLSTLRYRLDLIWDIKHCQLARFNFSTEWTWSHDFAMSVELRHRNAFDWRKVDQTNFFLDAFHSEKRLRHSTLSDARDTLLLHTFYRFHPNWACEATVRHGWKRTKEPAYMEYEIDLITTIQTAWHLRFSFQRQENDFRFAMYVNMGLKSPDQADRKKGITYYD